jgi:hypothetical protein
MRRTRAQFRGFLSGLVDSSVLLLALQTPIDLAPASAPALPRRPTAILAICPRCGRSVPFPVRTRRGALTLAECDDCDLYFEVKADSSEGNGHRES